jgi:hypothetical protein
MRGDEWLMGGGRGFGRNAVENGWNRNSKSS